MNPSHPLALYLADCRSRKSTGALTPETSLYQPLEILLNAAGATLKPGVRTIWNGYSQVLVTNFREFLPNQYFVATDED